MNTTLMELILLMVLCLLMIVVGMECILRLLENTKRRENIALIALTTIPRAISLFVIMIATMSMPRIGVIWIAGMDQIVTFGNSFVGI